MVVLALSLYMFSWPFTSLILTQFVSSLSCSSKSSWNTLSNCLMSFLFIFSIPTASSCTSFRIFLNFSSALYFQFFSFFSTYFVWLSNLFSILFLFFLFLFLQFLALGCLVSILLSWQMSFANDVELMIFGWPASLFVSVSSLRGPMCWCYNSMTSCVFLKLR